MAVADEAGSAGLTRGYLTDESRETRFSDGWTTEQHAPYRA